MQVQHELSLIEASQAKVFNTSNKSLDSYCLQAQLSNSMSPIEHLATSPSNSSLSLLACHLSQTNQILLFDSKTRNKRDKFPLKAYDKKYSRQSFQLSGIDFSPDGQRLAIGQTDCIIYIYKLTTLPGISSNNSLLLNGSNNNADDQLAASSLKPTITGKFSASSPITCMRWSELGIIFGSQDGRVRLVLSFNKPLQQQQQPPPPPPSTQMVQTNSELTQSQSTFVSTNQPNSTSSQAPKVMNLLVGTKKSSMPISLAYRNMLLLVGHSDCSVTILQLAQGSGVGPLGSLLATDSTTQPFASSDQSNQSTLSSLTPATVPNEPYMQNGSSFSRRSSSISAGGGQGLGVVCSSSLQHSCPPVNVAIIQNNPNTPTTICCSGSDGRIGFHLVKMQQDKSRVLVSSPLQAIELNEDIMSMDYSEINEVLALATKSRLVFVKYDQELSTWCLQPSTIELKKVFALATVKWLRDGGHLAVGCSSSSLELFKCTWSKQSVNDKLDICHIARNRIRITDRERNLLATYKTQADIKRVNLLDQGQSVLIWTTSTLLIAKLGNQRLQSEIRWSQRTRTDQKMSGVKFLFDQNSSFVLIYDESTNELSLLKLGHDSLAFSIKFPQNQRVKRDLLSVGQFAPSGAWQSPTRLRGSSSRNNSASSSHRNQQHRNSSLTNFNTAIVNNNNNITSAQTGDINQVDEATSLEMSSNLAPNSSVFERFAYVLNGTELNVIDLMASNRVIFAENQSEPIEWIKFSHSSRYLVFRSASKRLNLLVISCRVSDSTNNATKTTNLLNVDGVDSQLFSSQPEVESGPSVQKVDKFVLLDSCDGSAHWLPESDSLVAQCGPTIRVWYDLADGRDLRRQGGETFDSRAFNFLNRKPLINLSFVSQRKASSYPTLIGITTNHTGHIKLLLSNGQTVALDSIKTSFYAKIASDSLEAALELLDSQLTSEKQVGVNQTANRNKTTTSPTAPNGAKVMRPLYSKLGWLALEREGKCELAWRVFGQLNYRKLAKYLELCLQEPVERRRELMLAKLRANWANFEALAQDQDEIVATYRRLNKWHLLIDYLTRKQQFRQRDLAEHDHLQWLIQAGRHLEAAQLMVRDSNNLMGALELLLSSNQLEAAAELLLREQRLPLAAAATTLSNELGVGGIKSGLKQSSNLTANELKLRQLIESRICDKLLESGQAKARSQAAEICEKILEEPNRALELHMSGQDFQSALELIARRRDQQTGGGGGGGGEFLPEQIRQIELQYADFMRDQYQRDPLAGVSKKRAVKCIELYLRAGEPLRALEMANVLSLPERGLGVLIETRAQLEKLKLVAKVEMDKDETNPSDRERLLDQCKELGWQLLAAGVEFDNETDRLVEFGRKALVAFEVGEYYEQLIELLIELQEYDKAFRLLLERVNNNDRQLTERQFVALADALWQQSGQHSNQQQQLSARMKQAEQIYLLVNRAELAIEMYDRLGEHDKMLELVEQHQPDQLEGRLLQLAKWLESSNRLEEAEKYLLRASPNEWTNVVRMYRLSKRWPDAYRVARSNCISERDPLLVQLAYWWAKSIQTPGPGDESGGGSVQQARRSLLVRLNVLKQVVEFCCETKSFQFALDLLGNGTNGREAEFETTLTSLDIDKARREVVLRYATFLEQQHKFEQAERLLVDNNIIELAVKMYADNDDHKAAIRVIESQLAKSVGQREPTGEQTSGGSDHDELQQQVAKAGNGQQRKLVELLNSTLVECARRLVENLTPANSRGARLLSARSARSAPGAGQSATQLPGDKLQAAQQMLLRAQRPELAVEMFQSLGMWREAIQVAQRFAPRLLESVERALDEQVNEDIEPILRQSQVQSPEPATEHSEIGPNENRTSAQTNAESSTKTQSTNEIRRKSADGANEQQQQGASLTEDVRVWRQFEAATGQGHQVAARNSLDKFLELITKSSPPSSRQMRPLERFLLEMRSQRAPLVSSILSDREISRRVLALADSVLSSEFAWSGWSERPANETRSVWVCLRNVLSSYAELLTGSPLPPDAPNLERRVLVSHFVALHCSLVECLRNHLAAGSNSTPATSQSYASFLTIKQVVVVVSQAGGKLAQSNGGNGGGVQDTIDLLSKIAFSLLRYTDLIEAKQILWLAGLWQLGLGQHQVARSLWSLLVELTDRVVSQAGDLSNSSGVESTAGRLASELMESKLGQLVDVPELVRMERHPPVGGASSLSVQRLNQVRQWLLESLIEGGGGALGEHTAPWPVRGWASLAKNEDKLPVACCLACGLSATLAKGVNGSDGGGGPIAARTTATTTRAAVRRDELLKLISLCGIKCDGMPKGATNDMELWRWIGTQIEARRRGGAGFAQKRSRQLTAQDQLGEIVDFVLSCLLEGAARV